MDDNFAFARNLKALCEERNILQYQLAEQLELRPQTVSQWKKRGLRPRSPEVIRRLCDYFGVTEADLFGYSDGYYEKRREKYKKQTAVADVMSTNAAAPVPSRILKRYPQGFVLTQSDNSMDLKIPEGASVYIAEMDVETGDIACVSVSGTPLIRRVIIYDEAYILEPLSTNKDHRRQLIDRKDKSAPKVELLGRAVWYEGEL